MQAQDLIKRFEAAGGRLIWSDGKIEAEYPEAQCQEIAPLLTDLRQFRDDVARIVRERSCPLPAADVNVALKIGEFLETLPGHRSATATEIAEGLFGNYSLAHVIGCYKCCEVMEQAGVLIRGLDGYGYQLSRWARRDGVKAR